MSAKTTLAFAAAAGFLGGIASQHIAPALVHAQAQPSIPKEIRAETFVIVDHDGKPRGAFGIDKKYGPVIEITDAKGNAAWIRIQENIFSRKPTLVPPQ
jgi:hypothetical protein